MRTFIKNTLMVAFLAICSLATANNVLPTTDTAFTIDGNNVHYKIDRVDYDKLFIGIELFEDLEQMKFASKRRIEFIQIVNVHNRIEFQIPIESKKIVLDLQDFEDGTYALNFLVQGKEQMVLSHFTKK